MVDSGLGVEDGSLIAGVVHAEVRIEAVVSGGGGSEGEASALAPGGVAVGAADFGPRYGVFGRTSPMGFGSGGVGSRH
jgi:hypothetical protein